MKTKKEIEATVDRRNRNRGLSFDSEMLPYCERQFVVRKRVEKIINERTGELEPLRGDCIMLESVTCPALYHRFCQRRIYSYWREIWLTRVGTAGSPQTVEEDLVPIQRH